MKKLNRHVLRLPASLRQGLTLLSGTTLAQLIPAAASPIITRLFSPADVGAFAFVLAIFGLFAPVACLRYDLAIMIPDDEAKAAHLSALCVLVGTGAALTLLLALTVMWQSGLWVGAQSTTPLLIMVLPLGILLLSIQLVAQNWSLRTHNYSVQSRAVVVQACVTIGAQIAFGALLGSSAYTLVIATLAGYVALVLVYLPVLRAEVMPRLRRYVSRAGVTSAARVYIRFPAYTGPYAMLGQISARGAILVLAALAGADVVGQYALAQRVVFLPVVTLMAAASQIFYSRAARRLDDARMSHMVRIALVVGPLIVGPFFLLATLFAETIFTAVFGIEWREAGRFAAILALASMVKTLTVWLDRVFDIRRRQGLSLMLEALYAVAGCLSTYLALRLSGDAEFAIVVYASVTAGYLVLWMLCALRVGRFPLQVGGQFVAVTAAVSAVLVLANAAIAWTGLVEWARAICMVLVAATLSGAGLRIAAGQLRAAERPVT